MAMDQMLIPAEILVSTWCVDKISNEKSIRNNIGHLNSQFNSVARRNDPPWTLSDRCRPWMIWLAVPKLGITPSLSSMKTNKKQNIIWPLLFQYRSDRSSFIDHYLVCVRDESKNHWGHVEHCRNDNELSRSKFIARRRSFKTTTTNSSRENRQSFSRIRNQSRWTSTHQRCARKRNSRKTRSKERRDEKQQRVFFSFIVKAENEAAHLRRQVQLVEVTLDNATARVGHVTSQLIDVIKVSEAARQFVETKERNEKKKIRFFFCSQRLFESWKQIKFSQRQRNRSRRRTSKS